MAKGGETLGCSLFFNLGVSMLILKFLFPVADCSPHTPPGYSFYDVIIPRLLSTSAGKATRDKISFIIKAEGKNYIVHLKQKAVLVKRIPVFIYDDDDKVQTNYHEIRGNCYYRGYVEGASESFVTLSTCVGLRGLLQIENLTYIISPVEDSSTFQHLIYRTENNSDSRTCWLRDKDMSTLATELGQEQIPRKQGFSAPWKRTKHLELFIQVEVQLHQHYSDNVLTTTQHMVQLSQMVDDMFSTLGLRILLVGLGIWTGRNKVFITDYVKDSMLAFTKWQLKEVFPQLKHDASLLVAYRNRGPIIVTRSFFGTVCDAKQGLAFVSIRNMPLKEFAIAVAHELGHVIGIPDDQSQSCYCAPSLNCIMASEGPFGKKPHFSSCSAASYVGVISSGKGLCLDNIPQPIRILTPSVCGNGIVEGREECDCGDEPQCKRESCCLSDCTVAPGAECTTEACCKHCKAAPKGQVCRESRGECDLPEYCNGESVECPLDVFVQDGTRCTGDGYCYTGTCSTHSLQCQKVFGKESQSAPLACFEKVNSVGDRFGNCGSKKGDGILRKFQKCGREDVLCGRLQCTKAKRLPNLGDNVTIIQTPTSNALCWGIDFHPGIGSMDLGEVADGSKCGKDKVCINHVCTNLSPWVKSNVTCDPLVTCSGRGLCNSKEHCHCHYGWAPPDCFAPGFGGSTDSGPIPRSGASSQEDCEAGILVAETLGAVALFHKLFFMPYFVCLPTLF
ncbi:disintegrin and metalloproteinase domain-containing protein 9-like [Hemicordylus capensis]|uniref:disintegrin and metalloproteinase domain-containing protein 9-like n=1 Tax=Hemicordylus capensis TaxID=884348 RepID=UPI00230336CF|nr:disintegrin and metalloproteinase domain-containing protein 9-like [Hemicordylus capensis]